MLKIWVRAEGSNVIKAMWCASELGLAHERIDRDGEFGGNDDPQCRRKNPNGGLPTLEEEDGWTPREALPAHPSARAWHERLAARPAYQEHVIKVNAKRTPGIAARG